MPLFSGAQPPNEALFQPTQVSNENIKQPISDADVHDALVDEREDIEESRSMPKWLVQTLHDSKLNAPLSSRTRSGSHSTDYVSNSYALAVSNMCDEEEPLSYNEAHNSEIG